MEILAVTDREAFRAWLEVHHAEARECWVAVKRGVPTADTSVFWYLDAVEEALCFGWIDSTVKRVDGVSLQRFAPRKAKSQWSELNKERVRRQMRLGRMTPASLAVLPDMTEAGFVIGTDVLAALQKDPVVWDHFNALPPLYRRVRIDTIQINRVKRPVLFASRLTKFIEATRRGELIGAWNDGGRLL